VGPEFGLVQHQFEWLEWDRYAGRNAGHLIGIHKADEMQGDMPVCWRIALASGGPAPLSGMCVNLPLNLIIRPKCQK
jgi:hypothetical protein